MNPLLIVLMGLPGSGKSYLGSRLATAWSAELVQSDAVRKGLFPSPRYRPSENDAVFAEVHRRIGRALQTGRSVIVDATNLQEEHRQTYYRMGVEADAQTYLFWLRAPAPTARARLARRDISRDPDDRSDAGWEVYQWMVPGLEPPQGAHIILNATLDVDELAWAVQRIVGRQPPGTWPSLPAPSGFSGAP